MAACTVAVQQASRKVAQKAGPLDAQLFMIQHLLFLREQVRSCSACLPCCLHVHHDMPCQEQSTRLLPQLHT